MGCFHMSHFFFQMFFINIFSYNLIVTQLTFVKFVVLHLLSYVLEPLLFLYLCGACCNHVKFLFFVCVWWTLELRELESCCVLLAMFS